jgi:hypothetical protein
MSNIIMVLPAYKSLSHPSCSARQDMVMLEELLGGTQKVTPYHYLPCIYIVSHGGLRLSLGVCGEQRTAGIAIHQV